MARSYLKRNIRAAILTLILLVGLPVTGWATMAVFDGAAIAKLTDQLSKLQQQISAIVDVKNKVQEQIDAIGKLGQITLPSLNLDKLGGTIIRDLQCLKPDFSKLMPSIDLKDIKINSICGGSALYRDALWVDPDKVVKITTWQDRQVLLDGVHERRERLFTDTIAKALAHSDVAARDVEQTNDVANEVESSLRSSVNSRTSLQAIGQGQVAIIRALAKQNQLLSQLLKVQATYALKNVPGEARAGVDGDKKKPESKSQP